LFYLQQIINGIAQGSIYALTAVGYAIILGIVNIPSFVHGDVMMVGAFAGYYSILLFPHNILLVFIIVFIATWFLGIIVDMICYRRFRNSPRQVMLICTVGFSIFLKSSSQVTFGTQQKLIPNILGNNFFAFGEIRITYIQIFIVSVVIFAVFLLQILLYRTKIGLSVRAVSMHKGASALVGINVNQAMRFGNCLGCSMGGIAGILLGIYYNAVHPLMGGNAAMKAFVSVIFGGINIPGAALGGLLLGIFENMGVAFFGSGYRDIVGYVILIVVLLFKPSGLLGRKESEIKI